MELLKPYFLWSALAVAIPVLIHFWHQKKGKVMVWAAMQWLSEKNQQQNRGIQLDNIPLLIIRCLLLLLLAFLLSQPVWKHMAGTETRQRIHLIQPDAFLTQNFRFELEEAQKKGERVYWMSPQTDAVESVSDLPPMTVTSPLQVQAAINRVMQNAGDPQQTELHVYVVNDRQLAAIPHIYTPTAFSLHAPVNPDQKTAAAYLAAEGKKLFVNQANTLVSQPALEAGKSFKQAPVVDRPLTVSVAYRDKAWQKTMIAAVQALSDIYDIKVSVNENENTNTAVDWVLTDQKPATLSPKTVYIVSGTIAPATTPNVVYMPEPDDLIQTGRLPEWLGEQLIAHYNLNPAALPLSKTELNALFKPATPGDGHHEARTSPWLLIGFVVLVGLERWVALTKNA